MSPRPRGSIGINFSIGDDYVEVEAQVETVDRTGVEMEAMTACSVAALTVYDMCKSSDRTMTVEHFALWEKSGGRSGPWRRDRRLSPSSPNHLSSGGSRSYRASVVAGGRRLILVHSGEGRRRHTRPVGPTKRSSSLASPETAHLLGMHQVMVMGTEQDQVGEVRRTAVGSHRLK